jgi:hypothetical protein
LFSDRFAIAHAATLLRFSALERDEFRKVNFRIEDSLSDVKQKRKIIVQVQ